jgi:YcxB-like protein
MITLQGTLKPEDYIKAHYLNMQPNPWLIYFGIAFLSFCLVICVALTPVSVPLTTTLFMVFTPIFFLVISYVFTLLLVMWNVRRIFAQQKTLQVEYQTVISPEMIESTSENGTMRMRLSDFYKYKVGKDLILLYQSQAIFHIFPRRFFASDEDFNTFLSYLEANLGSPKR